VKAKDGGAIAVGIDPAVHLTTAPTAYATVRPAGGRIGSGSAPFVAHDPDRTLMAAIAAGDEAAFNEIHARYYGRVARFSRRVTRRFELTAEITNDTLWAVWRSAPSFRGNSKVSTWIMGIAYRMCSNKLKRDIRREMHEEPMEDCIDAAHAPRSDGDDREWLGAALIQLSEEQRTALELFYQFGHSCEEIAKLVDCPANTVKTRLYHGRRNLRRLLPRLAGS
jgi:RNA polymerase sigma-70 factor (ECF subfamily)